MAAAVEAPSAYSSVQLDANHARNFHLMLRNLRIGAGGNVLAGAQSTFNEAPRSTQVTRDLAGLETEAKAFQPMAYGATLGLVYYRMIGDQHRLMWDEAIAKQIRSSMITHMNALNARRDISYSLNANPSLSRDPAWAKTRDTNAQTIQNYARYAAFLATLQAKKMSVFPGMSDEILNNPLVIGANPWCLGTRPEFSSAYRDVWGTPAHADPSFMRATAAEKEAMNQLAGKMAEVAIEAKAVEYLYKFLEKGSDMALRGSLRAGMSLVCKIPILDMLVDYIKDLRKDAHLKEVQKLYVDEMERRMFLFSLKWGIWPQPEKDTVTAADLASLQSQR